MSAALTILEGDCLQRLADLPAASVHCCVTSPPYWALRDYGVFGQIGLEKSVEEYVERLVGVFAHVARVLRDDGTLWLNLGDCYTASGWGGGVGEASTINGKQHAQDRASRKLRMASRSGNRIVNHSSARRDKEPFGCIRHKGTQGLRTKNLIGIPWRVAFALQEFGWTLRSDIIWHKPNPMPESVTDRPTKCHEYIFLFSKSERYHYDAEAIKEPGSMATVERMSRAISDDSKNASGAPGQNGHSMLKPRRSDKQRGHSRRHAGFNDRWDAMEKAQQCAAPRNKRSVWTVPTSGYKEAHFATFPPDLIRPCILAGCPAGGTVLDPFGGSGTTGMVALEYGRNAVLIELNPEYAAMARRRCNVTPGLQFSDTGALTPVEQNAKGVTS